MFADEMRFCQSADLKQIILDGPDDSYVITRVLKNRKEHVSKRENQRDGSMRRNHPNVADFDGGKEPRKGFLICRTVK